MHPDLRNNIILLSIVGILALPAFSGTSTATTEKKAIFKIPKDQKAVTESSKQPIEKQHEISQKGKEDLKAKEKEIYSYDPTNKADPFKSFIIIKKELEETQQKRPRTYLETLDLSQLTVSATVLTPTRNWALVRDSKGDGHVIKVGTLIGKRGGRVIKVSEQEIIVRESYKNIRGREIVRDKTMKLPSVD